MKNNKLNPFIIVMAICMLATGCANTDVKSIAKKDAAQAVNALDNNENTDNAETAEPNTTDIEVTETSSSADESSAAESLSKSADSSASNSESSSTATTSSKAAASSKSESSSSSSAGTASASNSTAVQSPTNTQVSENTQSAQAAQSAENTQPTENTRTAQAAAPTVYQPAETVTAEYTANTSGKLDTSDIFSNRDLRQTADLEDAQYITVSDGETVNITEAGVYVISGSAENCTIRVETDKESKVQLVLNGVSIVNDNFPAIYVVSADKVFVTTTETENTLAVTGSFTSDGDTNTDAVIFSKDDLVLNGLGVLNISSAYGNGITSKDDLKVTGGTYNITTALDSIEANDSIAICDGTFTIRSSKDGLHCENDDDDSLGWIYISGGTFDINAKSDGIQGTPVVQIDGGTFSITASEGIEGTYVQINGGTVYISASDDGINASRKSTAQSVTIEINGGDLTVVMGQGDTDAIDANGDIYVNGGTINITATVSSFDYDGSAYYNGGTIIINGSQVDSIPQSMMGGPGGGFGGGNMGGGFGRRW